MIEWLSESETKTEETDQVINSKDQSDSVDEIEAKVLANSVEKAIELYRKVRENNRKDLSEKEITEIDKECEKIRNREVITKDLQHEAVEITSVNNLIVTGPPTLTRFEKARIVGARALQLSLGAPIFIEIPKNAKTSLEIAMEELKQRVLPIVIKRTLPNQDYQNIPLDNFE